MSGSPITRATKRAMDLAAACVGLVMLAPVLCAVAAVVRVHLGHPVLFRQMRPGLRGRPFELVKFRTMRDATDVHGRAVPDSERLTNVGAFLRRASLDELPELWNVIRGDMSLVGPRPLLMEYLPLYTPEQARRHDVRPGITGWAQVQGRNALSWEEKFELDTWYVDHQSLRLDLKIMAMTVQRVVGRRGVGDDGDAFLPRFAGSEPVSDPMTGDAGR